MNYLYFDTPVNQFQTYYGNVDQPFTKQVQSHLPTNVALMRIIAALAFSAILLIVKHASAWAWGVAAAGVTTAAWMVYAHIIRKDPFVEAMDQMVGGVEEYDKLPEFKYSGVKTYFTVDMINQVGIWNKLTDPVMKATTQDGRKVLIVNSLSRDPKQSSIAIAQEQRTIAFIEKYGPEDNSEYLSPSAIKFQQCLMALLSVPSYSTDTLSSGSSASRNHQRIESIRVASCLAPEMANEFYAQL